MRNLLLRMSSGRFNPFETFKKKERTAAGISFLPATRSFVLSALAGDFFAMKKRVACNRIYAVTPHVVNVF